MDLLVVIDLQEAFINENTKKAPEKIADLIKFKKFDQVLYTKFINDESNPVYKSIGWHGCMTKDSQEICLNTYDSKVLLKQTYSILNQEFIDYIKNNKIKRIILCGIDVECCVFTSAMNLFENNYDVYVLKDYCYSCYGFRAKECALEILTRNIGKNRVI